MANPRSPHDEDGHTPLCQLAATKIEEMDRRICQKFSDMDRRIDQRFELAQAAIDKAEHTMCIRLESMNQFRAQILDERASFATKRESVLTNFIISLVLVAVGLFFAHLLGK